MSVTPCNCAARWASVSCSCSWRDHLTKPITVTSSWLYDDGTDTHDATLTGLVYPDGTVEIQSLTVDATGEEVDVPHELRRDAEVEINDAAVVMHRRAS